MQKHNGSLVVAPASRGQARVVPPRRTALYGCGLAAVCLVLFAGVARAAVVLYVGGSTTTPCPNAAGAPLGEITVSVSAGGVIADGTYLTFTINPGILSSTPIPRAGSLASKGFVSVVDSGNFRFTFSTGTGSTTVLVGDYVTFGSMTGNAPGYDITVMASVSVSDPTIGFTNATVPIASVSAANCKFVAAGAAQGIAGGTARVPITLALGGASVNNVSFSLSITPDGSAPALSGSLSFQPNVALGVPTTNTPVGSNGVTVGWQGLTPALSGTVTMGEVLVAIPGTATPGESYTLQITAASGSMGASSVPVAPGPNATLGVVGPYPVPVLSSPSPPSAVAGGPAFTLTLTGANFVTVSVVRWNGADRSTTYVSATQLTASIPAIDVAAAGTAQIAVFNPAPGGGTSNALSFPINLAAPPAAVVKISGEPQSAQVGTALPNPLVVQVNRAEGTAIAGATVTFAVTGGSATLTPTTAVTNASGQAQVSVTLGTTSGTATISASVAGVPTPAVFGLTAAPGPAVSLAVVSGNHQTGVAGGPLPAPLVVKVSDQYDNPVSGITISFAVVSGGGSLNPTSVATGSNGQAQTIWTLGSLGASNVVNAAVHSTSPPLGPEEFTATGTVGPPAFLTIVSGNNQTAVVASTLPSALVVRVTDQYGNLLSGIAVNFAVTGGGGSLSAASVITAANGQAQVSWTLGGVEGSNTAQASVGGLAPVSFTATGAPAATAGGTATAGNAAGPPGGTARVLITLALNSGVSVDSLAFGLKVEPNGTAPAPTDLLSFAKDEGMPEATQVDPNAAPNAISVSWLGLSAALSGTVRLGEVVVPIPALATDGQTYTVRITGASGSLGTTNIILAAGANAALSVVSRSYLVGDAFPVPSANGDLNSDSDKDDAGEFGDDQLQILDLIYALRAVTSVPGYRPPACSDRFDAVDSHPADTPTVRGGNGILNTVDLIYTLRRVTSVDTSRPRRYSRNLPCTASTGPEVLAQASLPVEVAQAFQPGQVAQASLPAGTSDPAGSLRLGEPREVAVGVWQVPVYLEARVDLHLAGLSFALAIGNQPGVRWLRSVAGERSGDLRVAMKAPTLVDAGLPGVLAVAWLEGLQVAAGQRLLLGYIVAPGLAPGTDGLQFIGISANAPDSSEVRVSAVVPREPM